MTNPVTLEELADWMRRNGVVSAKLGEMAITFERTPRAPVDPDREPARLKTPEEIAAGRREERRRQYAGELGYAPTDEQLERLP
jgi:hypothetical protein